MKIRNRISGLGSFGAALSRIAEPHSLSEILMGEADGIRKSARTQLAEGGGPDSGRSALTEQLTVHPSNDGLRFTIGTSLDYGWHLEFGSLHGAPTPWLVPALEDRRPAILGRIRNWLAASGRRSARRR